MGAAALLFAAGGALAVAQPGDLGDDQSAAPAQETTSTTAAPTTSTAGSPATTGGTGATSTTTAPGSTSTVPAADETPTTVPGSGLAVAGSASGGSDGLAETGGESMVGAGLGLLGLGLVLRRAARVRTA